MGTTNMDDFLHDPTGSRRFWVVPIGGVDLHGLRRDRDQLVAEASVTFGNGERHWLSEAEEERREELAKRFVETDPWEERVLEYADGLDRVRTAELLEEALGLTVDKHDRRQEMRVARILRRSGYEKEQRRVDGKPQRFWVRSDR